MRRFGLTIFFLFACALLLTGCGEQEEPVKSEPIVTSEEIRGNAQNGKKLYEQFCLPCHGATGKGDGPTGQFLPVKPADFAQHMPHHVENWADYYFKIIKEGGAAMDPPRSPLMAPWGGQLKESDIWDVISYIRAFVKGH